MKGHVCMVILHSWAADNDNCNNGFTFKHPAEHTQTLSQPTRQQLVRQTHKLVLSIWHYNRFSSCSNLHYTCQDPPTPTIRHLCPCEGSLPRLRFCFKVNEWCSAQDMEREREYQMIDCLFTLALALRVVLCEVGVLLNLFAKLKSSWTLFKPTIFEKGLECFFFLNYTKEGNALGEKFTKKDLNYKKIRKKLTRD